MNAPDPPAGPSGSPDDPLPGSAFPAPEPVASPEPAPTIDPLAHRRAEPRGFAFLWTCYLLGSTTIVMGQVGGLGLSAYEVYRPAAQLLLTMVLLGIAIFWPLIRLSQETPGRPFRSLIADMMVMLAPACVMVLAQSLPGMAAWPLRVLAGIAAFGLAWSFLVLGTMLAAFREAIPRWWGMAVLVVLTLIGPAAGLGEHHAEGDTGSNLYFMTSPVTVVYELTRDYDWTGEFTQPGVRQWGAIGVIAGVSLIAVAIGLLVGSASRGVAHGRRPA